LAFSPDGGRFAVISTDRRVRVFNFTTGKLVRVLDETLPRFTELQQATQQLPNMEFGRRMAVERDLEKSEAVSLANIVFDYSGHFIMYATLLGIKLVNLYSNKCVRIIGKNENLRLLNIALYQGKLSSISIELVRGGCGNSNFCWQPCVYRACSVFVFLYLHFTCMSNNVDS
jgi:peptidylprolyl isomerase domain and WD repeat-containing protein 1